MTRRVDCTAPTVLSSGNRDTDQLILGSENGILVEDSPNHWSERIRGRKLYAPLALVRLSIERLYKRDRRFRLSRWTDLLNGCEQFFAMLGT